MGTWTSPLVKVRRETAEILGETTPFVFAGRLYRLENKWRYTDFDDKPAGYHCTEDRVQIRDMATRAVAATPLIGYNFATAFVWDEVVYLFAARLADEADWMRCTEIVMTCSHDLRQWTPPLVVLRAQPGEHLYNTGVCRDPQGFVMLYETDDAQWPPFTFKYCRSHDLRQWQPIPGALYGTTKYVGGPALYFEGGYYYTLYLHHLGGGYETRLTRSRDLRHWQDAPEDRPFLPYEPSHTYQSALWGSGQEISASDAELCYWDGKTLVYFTGGNQQGWCDWQQAEFAGTPRDLFAAFYR